MIAHFGDLRGRKHMFTLSILFMAILTLLIGLLPTYRSIGLVAPLLVLSMRILQGMCIGGGTRRLGIRGRACEMRKGRFRSWLAHRRLELRHPPGLTDGDLSQPRIQRGPDNCWRMENPFPIGGVFGFIATWLRRWLKETPVFEAMRKRASLCKLPLGTVLKNHGGAVAASILSTWMLTASIVVVMSMTPSLIPRLFGIAPTQVQMANLIATATLCVSTVAIRRCYRSIRSPPCCYTDTAGPDGFNLWAISRSRDYAILIAGTLCVGRSWRWWICPHTHHDDSRFSCVDYGSPGLIFLQPRLCAVRWIDPIVHFVACPP